jgi:hypothetical protein
MGHAKYELIIGIAGEKLKAIAKLFGRLNAAVVRFKGSKKSDLFHWLD